MPESPMFDDRPYQPYRPPPVGALAGDAPPPPGLPRLCLRAALAGLVGGPAIGIFGALVAAVTIRIRSDELLRAATLTAACAAAACALLAFTEGIALRFAPARRPLVLAAAGSGLALTMVVAVAIVFGVSSGGGPLAAADVLIRVLDEALREPVQSLSLVVCALVPFTTVGTVRATILPLVHEDKVGVGAFWVGLLALPASGLMSLLVFSVGIGSPSSHEMSVFVIFMTGAPPVAAFALSIAAWIEAPLIAQLRRAGPEG